MKYRIPVSKPWLTNLEREYLLSAYDSGQLTRGYWNERFEKEFAAYLGVKHALSCSSGTAACHLAVLTSGVQPYQSIYVPNLTFIATANAVYSTQINIKLGEINEESWNLDVEYFLKNELYNKVKGIFLVDLLGNPVNIEQWYKIAKQYDLVLIQDACEALGAEIDYAGKKYKCGSLFVRSSVFSGYGNKNLVGGGESGVFVTNYDDVYEHAFLLHGQYQHPKKRYYYEDIGFNYRMGNLQAAIFCAQLDRVNEIIEEKERVYYEYERHFKNTSVVMQKVSGGRSSYWIVGVRIKNRSLVEYELEDAEIEFRPMFRPVNHNPPYHNNISFPVSETISSEVLLLPTYCELTNKEIKEVCDIVVENNE